MNSKQKNTRNLYPSAFVLLHLLFFALPVKAQNAEETLPIYEISGKVTLGTGETGLAGCQVFLYKGALHEIARTTTDGNGWFTFGFLRVEPGPVRFLTAPPYDFITVPEVTLHLGKEREIRIRIPAVCEFEVSDLFSLAVQGFIRAGSPEQSLEGLEVVISRSEGHGIAQTRTNRGGFFHLHPKSLPPGRYDIAFRTGSELIPETTRSIELTNRNLLHEMNLLLPIRIEEPVYPGMVLGRVLLEPFGDMASRTRLSLSEPGNGEREVRRPVAGDTINSIRFTCPADRSGFEPRPGTRLWE